MQPALRCMPGGAVTTVSAPSLAGTALQVALTGCGGETAALRALDLRCAYTGLHAYTTLPVAPLTSTVTLSIDWYMDAPTLAPVQAVEFSLSTWLGGGAGSGPYRWSTPATAPSGRARCPRGGSGTGYPRTGGAGRTSGSPSRPPPVPGTT